MKTKTETTAQEIYYASNCFNDKLSKKQLEIIKRDPNWAIQYCENVLKSRWVEAEAIMLDEKFLTEANESNDVWAIFQYCEDQIKGRWKELEEKLLKFKLYNLCETYAEQIIKGRWEEAEEIIASNPKSALDYAVYFEFRFEMAEEQIKKDPRSAVQYVSDVLKDRWVEAEPFILNGDDLDLAIEYSDFIKGRWRELESKILSNAHLCMRYVKQKKKRWPEFEKRLISLKSPLKIIQYLLAVGKVGEEVHNKMILLSFEEKHKQKVEEYFYIIEERKKRHKRFLKKVGECVSKYKGKSVEEALELISKEEYSHIDA